MGQLAIKACSVTVTTLSGQLKVKDIVDQLALFTVKQDGSM